MAAPPDLLDQVSALHADAYGWAVACCGGDPEMAADALQESYVKIATGRAAFRGRSSLKTWWLGVVRITALEQHRGRLRWRRTIDAVRGWLAIFGEAGETAAPPATPDPDQLLAALAQLPARQAEILRLRLQHGLSLSEAADVMHISVGSARQHYERAKKRLHTHLLAPTATFPHAL